MRRSLLILLFVCLAGMARADRNYNPMDMGFPWPTEISVDGTASLEVSGDYQAALIHFKTDTSAPQTVTLCFEAPNLLVGGYRQISCVDTAIINPSDFYYYVAPAFSTTDAIYESDGSGESIRIALPKRWRISWKLATGDPVNVGLTVWPIGQ